MSKQKDLEIALKSANHYLEKTNQGFRLKLHKYTGQTHVEIYEVGKPELSISVLIAGKPSEIEYFLLGFSKIAWYLK